MHPVLIQPNEIRGIVTMSEAVEAVRLGFREWGENPQINAPRRRIHIPSGVRVSVRSARVTGAPSARKIGTAIDSSMCCTMCVLSSTVSYAASPDCVATAALPSPSTTSSSLSASVGDIIELTRWPGGMR